MTNNEKEIINNNFIEATHAVLDGGDILKMYGKYKNGEEKGKAVIGKEYLPYAIDVSASGFKCYQTRPVVKGGTHDDILTISRDENGNLVEKHGKSIPAELAEIYKLAEAKKKEVLGK